MPSLRSKRFHFIHYSFVLYYVHPSFFFMFCICSLFYNKFSLMTSDYPQNAKNNIFKLSAFFSLFLSPFSRLLLSHRWRDKHEQKKYNRVLQFSFFCQFSHCMGQMMLTSNQNKVNTSKTIPILERKSFPCVIFSLSTGRALGR